MAKKDEVFEINEASIEEKMRDFSELLNNIETLDDKKKKLWAQIYENAIADRHNAFIMFKELVTLVTGKSSEHAIHGRSLAAMLERMNKANDQLIKLAELVARAENTGGGIDTEELYKQLNGKR